jgi:hypothetical protein
MPGLRPARTLHRPVSTNVTTKVKPIHDSSGNQSSDPPLFYAEHWKIGTIARELNVHPDAVRKAIEAERFKSAQPMRGSIADPYLGFIQQTLEAHPRLRATRVYAMVRDRGYTGGIGQLRRAVGRLRPHPREAFLQLQTFPGEQGQVDWAHFGHVMVGRAKRALSCFVMTLSYSRALYWSSFSTKPWRTSCADTSMRLRSSRDNRVSSYMTISKAQSSNGAATTSIFTRG